MNTRKAGNHYQILLLYNDFKTFHDTSQVPLTSCQSDRGSGVSYTTNQQINDSLYKTRGEAQDQRREMLAFLDSHRRSPTVRIQ